MTLVADRFIRYDDGTVRDLATGEQVTLVEVTVTDVAGQVARRDRCLARLDAQLRGGVEVEVEVEREIACRDSHGTRLVDFALVGESLWIEAYGVETYGMETYGMKVDGMKAKATVSPRDGLLIEPVVDAIAATLDGLGSCDVRRLYVKAPERARLDTFQDVVAREVRARGFIPLSPFVVGAWPAVASLLTGRSIVLLGDARCEFSDVGGFYGSHGSHGSHGSRGFWGFGGTIARAIWLLRRAASGRTASFIAAIVARVCDHVNVAALQVMSASAARGVPEWSPQSVLRPAKAISYADADLPPLFPRTFQVARVAETAALAYDEGADEGLALMHVVRPEESAVENSEEAEVAAGWAEIEQGRDGDSDADSRYPPLRLVERRTSPEPAGHEAAVEIPVVTTMVSGYGDVADALVGRGRWAAASRALRAELAAYERRKGRLEAARTSVALGRLHLAMGETGPAVRWFDRAGELASASAGAGASDAKLIGEALRWSGLAALDDADLERSERLLRGALAAIGPEADPHQMSAIELSLARCLFWQGRAREIVLPPADEFSACLPGVILRVERWRRAARLALGDGDLTRAGDAIARVCRIARGDDENDVRSAGCRIEESVRVRARSQKERSGAADEVRIREALRAACHLDAARLQFAIGDTGSGDAHLRECLALSRVPARTARVQVLQLARLRSDRTGEGRRRFERLSAALRQPRTPRLVRIQARYLVDPRSRRAIELATFLDRHGDTALAGYRHGQDHADRPGGSPMLEAFQDVLRICHETPDDLTALARVSAFLRDRLRATSVAIYGAPTDVSRERVPSPCVVTVSGAGESLHDEECATPASHAAVVRFAVAGSTRLASPELAMRAIDSGLLIPPTYRADALDSAAPVRYGGAPIGSIVVRWSIDATLDQTHASALIGAAAAAVSPHLRAALDRQPPGAGTAGGTAGGAAGGAGANAPSRTLGLLGISTAMETLRHTITRVAAAPFHVLIEGESGSGKELVARALHQYGLRRHRRFCAVNCAALTDELLEAELFGHTRGAFTGALTERAGLFEEADGGTLFLDEIGELSPRGQAKLLRVIQDGETRRIGENLPRRVDTRILAATNRALRDEADAGRFRADLLYRLDIIRITVPPLRARPEDVLVLARAFWDEAVARLGSRATLDPGTLAALARYHWPGNVRELHNAIMALAVHAPPRGRVTPSQLPATFRLRAREPAASPGAIDEADDGSNGGRDGANDGAANDGAAECDRPERGLLEVEGSLEDAKRAFESRYVRAALARAGGSPSRAARNLGLTRQGLAKLIARLGLDDGRAADTAAARGPRPARTRARKERAPP